MENKVVYQEAGESLEDYFKRLINLAKEEKNQIQFKLGSDVFDFRTFIDILPTMTVEFLDGYVKGFKEAMETAEAVYKSRN